MFSRVNAATSRKRRKLSKVSSEESEQSSQFEESEAIAMTTTPPQQSLPTSFIPPSDVDAVRDLIVCKVCQRFLSEPYTLGCGHSYCYICLDSWLVTQKKTTCPECRALVMDQPVPSLIIRHLVDIFSQQRLLQEDDNIEEIQEYAREATEKVAADKANKKGLYNWKKPHIPIFDDEERVMRCPICLHEVEHGYCSGCGELMGTAGRGQRQMISEIQADLDLEFGVDEFEFNSDTTESTRIQRAAMRAMEPSTEEDTTSEMDDFIVPDDDEGEAVESEARVRPTRPARRPRPPVVFNEREMRTINNARARYRPVTSTVRAAAESLARVSRARQPRPRGTVVLSDSEGDAPALAPPATSIRALRSSQHRPSGALSTDSAGDRPASSTRRPLRPSERISAVVPRTNSAERRSRLDYQRQNGWWPPEGYSSDEPVNGHSSPEMSQAEVEVEMEMYGTDNDTDTDEYDSNE